GQVLAVGKQGGDAVATPLWVGPHEFQELRVGDGGAVETKRGDMDAILAWGRREDRSKVGRPDCRPLLPRAGAWQKQPRKQSSEQKAHISPPRPAVARSPCESRSTPAPSSANRRCPRCASRKSECWQARRRSTGSWAA